MRQNAPQEGRWGGALPEVVRMASLGIWPFT